MPERSTHAPSEQPIGLQELMGYRLAEWSGSVPSWSWRLAAAHLNRAGVLHGGVLATLLDSALGYRRLLVRRTRAATARR